MSWDIIRRRKGTQLGNEVCTVDGRSVYIPRHLLERIGLMEAHRIAIEVNRNENKIRLRRPEPGEKSTNSLTRNKSGSKTPIKEALRQLGKKFPFLSTRLPAVIVENALVISVDNLEDKA